jgi:hypothetical protein
MLVDKRSAIAGQISQRIAQVFGVDGVALFDREDDQIYRTGEIELPIPTASAVKITYAAWSKGTAAMLLDILELARAEGVEEALLALGVLLRLFHFT